MYNGLTHDNILEILSDAINTCDKNKEYGTGDSLFDVITALKQEWGIDIEE